MTLTPGLGSTDPRNRSQLPSGQPATQFPSTASGNPTIKGKGSTEPRVVKKEEGVFGNIVSGVSNFFGIGTEKNSNKPLSGRQANQVPSKPIGGGQTNFRRSLNNAIEKIDKFYTEFANGFSSEQEASQKQSEGQQLLKSAITDFEVAVRIGSKEELEKNFDKLSTSFNDLVSALKYYTLGSTPEGRKQAQGKGFYNSSAYTINGWQLSKPIMQDLEKQLLGLAKNLINVNDIKSESLENRAKIQQLGLNLFNKLAEIAPETKEGIEFYKKHVPEFSKKSIEVELAKMNLEVSKEDVQPTKKQEFGQIAEESVALQERQSQAAIRNVLTLAHSEALQSLDNFSKLKLISTENLNNLLKDLNKYHNFYVENKEFVDEAQEAMYQSLLDKVANLGISEGAITHDSFSFQYLKDNYELLKDYGLTKVVEEALLAKLGNASTLESIESLLNSFEIFQNGLIGDFRGKIGDYLFEKLEKASTPNEQKTILNIIKSYVTNPSRNFEDKLLVYALKKYDSEKDYNKEIQDLKEDQRTSKATEYSSDFEVAKEIFKYTNRGSEEAKVLFQMYVLQRYSGIPSENTLQEFLQLYPEVYPKKEDRLEHYRVLINSLKGDSPVISDKAKRLDVLRNFVEQIKINEQKFEKEGSFKQNDNRDKDVSEIPESLDIKSFGEIIFSTWSASEEISDFPDSLIDTLVDGIQNGSSLNKEERLTVDNIVSYYQKKVKDDPREFSKVSTLFSTYANMLEKESDNFTLFGFLNTTLRSFLEPFTQFIKEGAAASNLSIYADQIKNFLKENQFALDRLSKDPANKNQLADLYCITAYRLSDAAKSSNLRKSEANISTKDQLQDQAKELFEKAALLGNSDAFSEYAWRADGKEIDLMLQSDTWKNSNIARLTAWGIGKAKSVSSTLRSIPVTLGIIRS